MLLQTMQCRFIGQHGFCSGKMDFYSAADSTVGLLASCEEMLSPACWPSEFRSVSCMMFIVRWHPSPWPA